MRLYGIVKQSREEISSRLFSWQNFFDSAVPKRQGAARFGRLPFFVPSLYPSILYKRINLIEERAFDDLLFVKQRAYAVCDQERAENAADDDTRDRAAR